MNNVYWGGAQEGLLSFGGGEEIRVGYMEVVTSEQSGRRISSGHKETVGAEGPWSKEHRG